MDVAVRSVYDQLEQILEANGLSPSNVVKESVFATDLDSFIENRAIRKECYGQTLPAASWVQVRRLYLPSFAVEVELTAGYPVKTGRKRATAAALTSPLLSLGIKETHHGWQATREPRRRRYGH